MPAPKDRLFRHLAILRMIPRYPRSISTTELLEKLKGEEFDIDLRSLQRDLVGRLSTDFPIQCDESKKPFRWSFAKDTPQFDLPAVGTSTALAFVMAEDFLNKILPSTVCTHLLPHFDLARRQIQGLKENDLNHWFNSVRSLHNNRVLKPAEVDAAVWAEVSRGLLRKRKLETQYLSRSKGENKSLCISPLGIVTRHYVSYLIGRVDGYMDVRQFAIHRMSQTQCTDVEAVQPNGFDIDEYLLSGDFNNPVPVTEHKLVADVSAQVAWLLQEAPFNAEQKIEPIPGSDWHRVSAIVSNNQETLAWIFGMGEGIRVHQPESWRDTIKSKLQKMAALYSEPYSESASAFQETL